MSDRSIASPPDKPRSGIGPPQPPDAFGDGGGDGHGHGLVRVAIAAHESEAVFIQQLLAAEGIRSVLKRSRGFDVPDFLAAGPRDVFVERYNELDAREALLQTGRLEDAPNIAGPDPIRLLAGLLLTLAVVAVVLWLGFG